MLESVRRVMNDTRRSFEWARLGSAAYRVVRATDADRPRAERALSALMADARGLPMKFGQFLASGDEHDPYSPLVESVEPEPLVEVLPAVEHSLQRPVDSVFARFEESTAAASLGQVHQAEFLDGTMVAVKVRYPNIRSEIESTLRVAGLMPGVGPIRQWGFDIESYRRLLAEDFERELDYASEAERQNHFRQNLCVPGLVIPEVFDEHCREDLLVQSWEEGTSLIDFAKEPIEDRRKLGRILLKTLFRSLFVLGEVHADPHLGNLKVRRSPAGEPEVVLLDFGCTVEVSLESRLAFLKLILAARDRTDDVSPIEAYAAMGFDATKLAPIANALPALTTLLLQPFVCDELLNLETWNLAQRLERLLGEHRWWFRSAGPTESVLLVRAIHGLFLQFRTLKLALPWWPLLVESIGEETLEEARRFALPRLPVGVDAQCHTLGALANSLRVRVCEGERQRVSISMPAEVSLDLRAIVPEDILATLAETDVDLDALEARVRDSGIAPQEILSIVDGQKRIQVWLE